MGRPDIEKMERNRDVEGLIKALGDEDGNIAMAAHSALCEMGKATVVVPLINALRSSDNVGCRRLCADILGQLSSFRPPFGLTIEPLISALKDDDKGVRGNAALSLGLLCDPKAVEPLIKALEDDHEYVRKNAAFALGCIEDKRAIKQLTKLLNDDSKEVRDTAENALERIQRR